MIRSVHIHVQGIVQGVGFRPFVYRLARRNLVCGTVRNGTDGVHIEAEGEPALLEGFIAEISSGAPSAARIASIDVEDVPLRGFSEFTILQSESVPGRTQVSADIATCGNCLAELFDEDDRRFHYPFINCTDCGPRFTIIDALPYDRSSTSMREFEMCDECAKEYFDVADRRFHAQPDACFKCGPSLRLDELDGPTMGVEFTCGASIEALRERSDAIIERTAELLRDGNIVAIKGLGGYHLACDATNEEAVSTLRERKHRYGKPLAIMVRDADAAAEICLLGEQERELLTSSARPIVLLERRGASAGIALARGVADDLHEVGIMLPCTPLQHLLMARVGFPLVMTSGNLTDEPIASGNDEAHRRLGNIADAFLDNDRKILSKYDDSVLRIVDGRRKFVRRARGYAPVPLEMPRFGGNPACILGVGAEQKSTFCLSSWPDAFVSQHLGDLEDADSMENWRDTLELYKRLFKLEPTVVACDMHPEYLSTKWVGEQGLSDSQIERVQHHHAHIASVLAEHIAAGRLGTDEHAIGIALDGTGFGDDGKLWGGELLACNCAEYKRLAHLAYQPLIGSAAAIRHPVRIAYAMLLRYGLADHPAAKATLAALGEEQATILAQMLEKGVNTIEASAVGRLFDGMSALLGICRDAEFDGQAPMLLEAAMYDPVTGGLVFDEQEVEAAQRYRFEIIRDGEDLVIEPRQAIVAALDDMAAGTINALISLRFHRALVDALAQACKACTEQTGIGTVALSGGVFMNRFILQNLTTALESRSLRVLTNVDIPANDGCISYGQVAVAAARMGKAVQGASETAAR
ncbi:MAG: carbamoyltransferase HypF [bacterium]|nr:carbamoyltransferase HypF [bacterium]